MGTRVAAVMLRPSGASCTTAGAAPDASLGTPSARGSRGIGAGGTVAGATLTGGTQPFFRRR
jgi:hypothetical protein